MFSDILLTVDYDRTLTSPENRIPPENLEAIRYFMENGGAFTVNTGRSVPMIREILDTVPVNAPLLLYNGSAAYDTKTGTLAFCHEIRDDMRTVVNECLETFPDLPMEVQGLKAHYCFRKNTAWEQLCQASHCAWAMASPEDDLGPFLKFSFYGPIHSDRITDMFEGTPQELARIDQAQQQLTDRYGDHMEVFRSGARILDVHAKGVSKNRSAQELKAQLGRKILICAGDGENDVSMLDGADYAFCPADAPIADRYPNVCSCAQGAVADVIYKEIPKIISVSP